MTGYQCALDARAHRKKTLVGFILFAGLFLFAGCGDDGPTPPPLAPTMPSPPPPPPMAHIEIEVLNFGAFANRGGGTWFQIEFRLTESAGVGAHINFARLEVFRATGELEERAEIGANDIVRGVDDNRLEGNTEETAVATFLFRATVKKGRTLHYSMGFTDDGGHDHELVERFIFR